jgi:hypothetical protein
MELSTYTGRHLEFRMPGGAAAAHVATVGTWHTRFWVVLAVAGFIAVLHWIFG